MAALFYRTKDSGAVVIKRLDTGAGQAHSSYLGVAATPRAVHQGVSLLRTPYRPQTVGAGKTGNLGQVRGEPLASTGITVGRLAAGMAAQTVNTTPA